MDKIHISITATQEKGRFKLDIEQEGGGLNRSEIAGLLAIASLKADKDSAVNEFVKWIGK